MPRGALPAPGGASPMPRTPSPTTLPGWWIPCSALSALPSALSPLASSGAVPRLPALILEFLGKDVEYTGVSTRASPPRCARGSVRPCAPRALGSLPTPTSAAATTVAQRHQPAYNEKGEGGHPNQPCTLLQPPDQGWAHPEWPQHPEGLSSGRAHRGICRSDSLPQPLSQGALRFPLRVPIWGTDEPEDVTASPSTHQVQWWAGQGPVCCGLTRSRGSPEQAAATVTRSPACTNFLGTAQRLSQHRPPAAGASLAPTAPPGHG